MIFKGRLCLPHTIDEESDEDEFIIEYVTDSEEENAAGSDEEWWPNRNKDFYNDCDYKTDDILPDLKLGLGA